MKDIVDGKGFFLGTMSHAELSVIKEIITKKWRCILVDANPSLVEDIRGLDLKNYHTLADKIDHKSIFKKENRIITPEELNVIKSLGFFKNIMRELKVVRLANEENLYDEEMYWRLVRPTSSTDVGPLHADSWFWELGHGSMPAGTTRKKIWISIENEMGENGLQYAPNSHRTSWEYDGVFKDGMVKPSIKNAQDLDVYLFETRPGDYVVFHDDLIHGGVVGGKYTRVSIECTFLCKEDNSD